MSVTFEVIDQLYRSRLTILQMLKDRDYNTKPYENFGPAEIESMLVATANNRDKQREKGSAFRIDVERLPLNPDSTDLEERERAKKWSDSPIKKCRVMYVFNRLKNRIVSFMETVINSPDSDDYVNPADTELIVILALPEGEPVVDTFHAEAFRQWSTNKLRVSFFRLANLVIHPSSHILVPKHDFVPKASVPFTPTERLKLPFIRFHEDMQARILGLVPGDIVKITRPSPAAGEYTIYRICA